MADPETPEPPGADPLCFVLMPFGRKQDQTGTTIDFDAVYHEVIEPAILAAELDPIRADEEMTGGIVQKPMFERLVLCEYAVADLTLANANVFYELGIRHAVRPYTTALVFASGSRLPFDVSLDRGLPYSLGPNGDPVDATQAAELLTDRLVAARDRSVDSPLFQLLEDFPQIDRLKTDVFRDRVRYSEQWKQRLAEARRAGAEAVRAVQADMGDLPDVESGVLVDLLLSYRAVKAHEDMVALVEQLPAARTATVREQLGFALNRLGRGDDAERVLLEVIAERGPSSETYAPLGRVYKDRWSEAMRAGESFLAGGVLEQAVDAYRKGFEADWRDDFPGVNAVTLMELQDPPDPRRERLIPVVAYAAERRVAGGEADYWDHATLLELAVLARDETAARGALGRALALVREVWEPESTANNLRLIREARERRGENVAWAGAVEQALLERVDAG